MGDRTHCVLKISGNLGIKDAEKIAKAIYEFDNVPEADTMEAIESHVEATTLDFEFDEVKYGGLDDGLAAALESIPGISYSWWSGATYECADAVVFFDGIRKTRGQFTTDSNGAILLPLEELMGRPDAIAEAKAWEIFAREARCTVVKEGALPDPCAEHGFITVGLMDQAVGDVHASGDVHEKDLPALVAAFEELFDKGQRFIPPATAAKDGLYPRFRFVPRPDASEGGGAEVACGSCDWKGAENQLKSYIADIFDRLDVGGEVPAGDCPECGAFAYIEREDRKRADDPEGAWHNPPDDPDDVKIIIIRGGTHEELVFPTAALRPLIDDALAKHSKAWPQLRDAFDRISA